MSSKVAKDGGYSRLFEQLDIQIFNYCLIKIMCKL